MWVVEEDTQKSFDLRAEKKVWEMVNYKNVKRRRMKRREKGDKDEHIVEEIVEKIASQQAHTDWSGEQILSNCINSDDKKKRAKEEKNFALYQHKKKQQQEKNVERNSSSGKHDERAKE